MVALGDNRNDLFLDFVSRKQEDKEAQVTDTVATLTKVTGDYHTYLAEGDTTMKTTIESVVGQSVSNVVTLITFNVPLSLDVIVAPLFQEGLGSLFVNEILVHIGLLKVRAQF